MSDCPFCGRECFASDNMGVVFVCFECLVEWPAGHLGELVQHGSSPMSKMAVVHDG
tara:strand:- start:670 stop:837 length:168 start_codon:yes stop_codon:yes gene_type:complete